MHTIIQLLIPGILIIIVYIFILSRKGEMQRAKVTFGGQTDWITWIGVIFGTEAMWTSVEALNIHIPDTYWVTIAIPVFLLVVFIIKYANGKRLLRPLGDERINAMKAKSGRNALFTTYLVFFIHSLITSAGSLDATWVIITIASGFVVLIASYYFYYFRTA
jgi:hypothetical protein